MLTAVLSVVAHGTSEQTVICVLVSVAFVKLYAFFAPYMDISDDILAEVGQYQILFTFFGALIMQGELVRSEYNTVIGVALIIVNVGIIFVPLWLGYQEYQENKEKEREEEEKERQLELEREQENNHNNNNHNVNDNDNNEEKINSSKSKDNLHVTRSPAKDDQRVYKQKSVESLHMQRVRARAIEYQRQHSNQKSANNSPNVSPRNHNSNTSSPSKPVSLSGMNSSNNSESNINLSKDSNEIKPILTLPPPSSTRQLDYIQSVTTEQPNQKIILKPISLSTSTHKILPSPRFESFDDGEWDDYKPLNKK